MLNKHDSESTPAESDILLSSLAGPVATLTLNRPSSRNSLSANLIAALYSKITELSNDAAVRVIIIKASEAVFCSGHDLKELTEYRLNEDGGRGLFRKVMAECSAMMMSIVQCPKPVIASVQGTATAAGCQLVASCDLAVASEDATFSTPGVNIGLFCSTPGVALSRNIGRKHAMEMLLLGEHLSAMDAEFYGLINRAVPAESLMTEVESLAQRISQKSPKVLSLGKQAFYRQLEMPLQDAYDYAAKIMAENMMSPDAEEGIGAFLEKRTPRWH